MNQNLLYIVARANVDRIYGDLRFDFIDDDFTEAVVAEGARLPGRDHDQAVRAAAPASRTRNRSGSKTKMTAMAARTRGRTTR